MHRCRILRRLFFYLILASAQTIQAETDARGVALMAAAAADEDEDSED